MKNLFNVGFVVLILVVLGCNCQKLQDLANQQKQSPSTTPVTTSSPSTNGGGSSSSSGSGLSLDKYNQIKNGMTYQEVKDIIGKEGTETMSSGEGKYKVESYKWEGDNYQFISVVFTGGKVQSKVQANLK